MPPLVERAKAFVAKLHYSPAQPSSAVAIPAGNVEGLDSTPLVRDQSYFVVRVNEMYLDYARLWTKQYDPLVFVLTEFAYNDTRHSVPFVVGPKMLASWGQELPKGMLFTNTRVAGAYPYRGGQIGLSVVLGRVAQGDIAQQVLQMLDDLSTALTPAVALGSYVKMAGAVLTGLETLFGVSAQTAPIVGLRTEFDPFGGSPVRPSYFALIEASGVDGKNLSVRDGHLYHEGSPYRDSAFVLYSLIGDSDREDVDLLPFQPLWRDATRFAAVNDETAWLSAKSSMSALYQQMALSPDLISGHVQRLAQERKAMLKALHEGAIASSELGSGTAPDVHGDIWQQSAQILEL